jgi:hypothetical protein
MPEVYSPLWLNSNLNLPRDRATINAWNRSFYALNPIVHNAINLHSTYPISKLNIKCPNKKVEQFFNTMIEEIDLMNVCVQVAQEYWLLGEAFIYAELDEAQAKWSRLVVQNPDYMVVKRSVLASEPIIMMRPDENLRRIVFSNRPADLEQKAQLNPTIVEHIKRGENIPLDSFYVSHIARRISPYEVRGTGLAVSCFRQLCLFDQLRECFSDDTEVLTDQGFKTIYELLESSTDLVHNPNLIAGLAEDHDQKTSVIRLRDDFKVACVNENNEVEFHKPLELHMSQYNGKMFHFKGDKVDTLVSPNHNIWVKEKTNGKWGEYKKIPAAQILDKKKHYKFKSEVDFGKVQINNPETIDVCGHAVETETYLKVLGYLASEGCVYENFEYGRYDAFISMSQKTNSDCIEDMQYSLLKFANMCGKSLYTETYIQPPNKLCGLSTSEMWEGRIHGKDISGYFKNAIGVNGNTKSINKHLPRFVFDLDISLMKILLEALVKGDGCESKSKYNDTSKSVQYTTISKQLCDDVYELAYRCGYVPNIGVYERDFNDGLGKRHLREYRVLWSNTHYGVEPIVYTGTRNKQGNGGGASVSQVDYNAPVWCFEVPTGLLISRRNGKVSVQGNSKFVQAQSMITPMTIVKVGGAGQDGFKPTMDVLESYREQFEQAEFDKNFKLFTHDGVSVERVGWNSAIVDISGDITQLIKEVYMGLMVPSVLMDGGGDITYANGGVSLDVLRQRYMQFRNMMAAWLKNKIFAPIAKLNDFYDYEDGIKKLIIPEVDWNYMTLFESMDFINVLVQLSGDQKKVSQQSLYRSLGLDYDEERRKIRKEDIAEAIRTKELATLGRMPLTELRALSESDDIPDILDDAVPADSPYADPAGGAAGGAGLPGGAGGAMSLPGLGGGGGGGTPDLGAPPPPPGGSSPPPPPPPPSV